MRDQGAFISVSHPFDRYRKGGWELPDLQEITPYVDALEAFNARCLQPGFNRSAAEYAAQHAILLMVGSDAHYQGEVGAARQILPPFSDPGSLKAALHEAQVIANLSPAWVHLYSTYAKTFKEIV